MDKYLLSSSVSDISTPTIVGANAHYMYTEAKPFSPFNKPPEITRSDKELSITCNICTKAMMVTHVCYNKCMEAQRHVLEGHDVCHWCWDKNLADAVATAGF